ncbi:MAG TPA: dihydrodipicolinate synthase family protein [Acidiferrobacterales bacterium]|nr:dihydrodipicolinate synthase family protein [Acidiferrobacterales bacterium]
MPQSLKQTLDLPGLVVPPLTPFRADGGIDYPALATEVDYILDQARPAVLAIAAVEAQEYQFLSDHDRAKLIRSTADMVAKRVPILVGVSHPSIMKVKELCSLATEVGADAVQVLIPLRPSGGAASREELIKYFTAVAKSTDVPMFAYHNPGPGAELGPADLCALCRIPGVQACKESSRNLRHIGLTQSMLPEDVLYFTTMEVLSASLDLGCAGGTMPPPGAVIGRKIIDAYRRGDYAEAKRYQRMFMAFPGPWMRYGLVAVMKAAMNAIGVPVGDHYPPFGQITEEDRAAISDFVRNQLGLGNAETSHQASGGRR